jgi:hypothetical protein
MSKRQGMNYQGMGNWFLWWKNWRLDSMFINTMMLMVKEVNLCSITTIDYEAQHI